MCLAPETTGARVSCFNIREPVKDGEISRPRAKQAALITGKLKGEY